MDESYRDDVYASNCQRENRHAQRSPEEVVEDRAEVVHEVVKIVAMNVANRGTLLDSAGVVIGT
jgi:hypothetical protein